MPTACDLIAYADIFLGDKLDARQANGTVASPSYSLKQLSRTMAAGDLRRDRRKPSARRRWRRLRDAGCLVIEQAILEALNEDRAPAPISCDHPAYSEGAPVALDLPNLHNSDFRELAYVIDDPVEPVFTDPPSPLAKPAVPLQRGDQSKAGVPHWTWVARIPPRVRQGAIAGLA